MKSDEGSALVLYLVDDDRGTRVELGRILKRHTHFNVIPLATPSEALERVAVLPPDIALLDLRLPEMDGLTLLAKLREEKEAENLMAIIMTGYGEADTARKARESGAVDFIEKPLDLPYLLVVLRQMGREAELRKNLRAAAGLFAGVLDMIPDGIVMTVGDGNILFANRLGRELMKAGYNEAGKEHRVNNRVYALESNASGNRVLLHWIDLTASLERERLRAYREMARHLAHEVRNPLTPMRLWLQELESIPADDPGYAESVKQAVDVLSGQVDRLLTLLERFRILGSEKEIELEPVDVRSLVEEVTEALEPLAAAGKVVVILPEEGSWSVMGEEMGLYQCLFNVLRNSIEAAPEGGAEVRIEVVRAGDAIEISVIDDAGGLPSEVAADPFAPYLTTKEGGTGLGLLVSRDLAGKMGGNLRLENRQGEGVTVKLTLPSAEA